MKVKEHLPSESFSKQCLRLAIDFNCYDITSFSPTYIRFPMFQIKRIRMNGLPLDPMNENQPLFACISHKLLHFFFTSILPTTYTMGPKSH